MKLPNPNKSIFSYLIVIILIIQLAFAAIAPTTTSSSTVSSAFATPTMNFDFSSITSQSSAQSTMDQAKSSWNNFFDNRADKPVFTDQLTNVVQGSDNQLRGTQN